MYAVIKTGGKQYRVRQGDIIRVEKLAGSVGDKVKFEEVLMLGGDGEPLLGSPTVKNATVNAEIVEQGKGRKVIVFKHKRRKGYRRKQGHRQLFTAVAIRDIKGAAKKANKTEQKPPPEEPAEPTENITEGNNGS